MEIAEYEKMYLLEDHNWWYKGRRELLLDLLDQFKRELNCNYLSILDVGCGTGINLKYLDQYGKASGLDFSKDALYFSRSRGNAALVCGSGDCLPFKNNSFDIVCAMDVLEHIEDDEGAVRELFRILRIGGYLILTVPAFQLLWSQHDAAAHHKRRYNQSDLLHTLTSCGFFIKMCTYWNSILFPIIAIVKLFKKFSDEEPRTDIWKMPWIINNTLLSILRIEHVLIQKNMFLPVGVSLLCICRKCQSENAT